MPGRAAVSAVFDLRHHGLLAVGIVTGDAEAHQHHVPARPVSSETSVTVDVAEVEAAQELAVVGHRHRLRRRQ